MFKSSFYFTLLATFSFLSLAQQPVKQENVQEALVNTVDTVDSAASVTSRPQLPDEKVPPRLSKAAEKTVQLASYTDYTASAPGSCLVIDDLVRQFCSANPGDISCQFQ